MRRKLFNLAAAVSLVLCVGTIVFWVRSYHELVAVRISLVAACYDAGFPAGKFAVTRADPEPEPGIDFLHGEKPVHMDDLGRQTNVTEYHTFLGFGWWHATTGNRAGMMMPCWFLAVLFAITPAAWMHTRVKDRRAKREGMCASCGYDLRATPERCPECGAVPLPAK